MVFIFSFCVKCTQAILNDNFHKYIYKVSNWTNWYANSGVHVPQKINVNISCLVHYCVNKSVSCVRLHYQKASIFVSIHVSIVQLNCYLHDGYLLYIILSNFGEISNYRLVECVSNKIPLNIIQSIQVMSDIKLMNQTLVFQETAGINWVEWPFNFHQYMKKYKNVANSFTILSKWNNFMYTSAVWCPGDECADFNKIH